MSVTIDNETADLIRTIVGFAERSGEEYKHTRELTATSQSSCMTIRVPTALLNRIRELGNSMATVPAARW